MPQSYQWTLAPVPQNATSRIFSLTELVDRPSHDAPLSLAASYFAPLWDSGTAVPTTLTDARGLAYAPSGDLYVVERDNDKVFVQRASSGQWDSAVIDGPTGETSLNGLDIDAAGTLWAVGGALKTVYRRTAAGWLDSGIGTPTGIGRTRDVAVDPATGDVYLLSNLPNGYYQYDRDASPPAWQAIAALPSGATNPWGIAFTRTGDLALYDSATNGWYTREAGGAWSAKQDGPTGETNGHGIAFNSAGYPTLAAGGTSDKIYRQAPSGIPAAAQTIAVKLQSRLPGQAWADVTGASLTAVNTQASVDNPGYGLQYRLTNTTALPGRLAVSVTL